MKYRRIYDFAVVYYDRKRRRLRMYMTMAENAEKVRADFESECPEREAALMSIVRSPEQPHLEVIRLNEKNP